MIENRRRGVEGLAGAYSLRLKKIVGLVKETLRSLRTVGFKKTGLRIFARLVQINEPSEGNFHFPKLQTLSSDDFLLVKNEVQPIWISRFSVKSLPAAAKGVSVAVHLVIEGTPSSWHLQSILDRIPMHASIFVSVFSDQQLPRLRESIAGFCKKSVQFKVFAQTNQRSLGLPILDFGRELADFDVVGSFKFSMDEDLAEADSGYKAVWDALIPLDEPSISQDTMTKFLGFLGESGGVVFAESQKSEALPAPLDFKIANEIASKLGIESKVHEDSFRLPKVCMFWASKASFLGILRLADNMLVRESFSRSSNTEFTRALTAIIPMLLQANSTRVFRAMSSELFGRSVHYEPQEPSGILEIADTVPEVFAYYLPQFHPIPENSLWHGEGFTEWHKVRGAQPLFYGHYQQHVPHFDLGYYEILDAEILRKQTQMMVQGGVDGLIFYHYWFGGKLILEGPSRLLQSDPSIRTPFAFCWANENWTRRWDGNDEDVLLEQNYSEDDARAFIKYLLPFFADDRYIRRGNRPLLMIYRPEHNPIMRSYVRIWREECAMAGESSPLLTGVMTRGSSSPGSYGFDAAAERPLWDWTDGKVPDVRNELATWETLNADVLNYSDVAEFYSRNSSDLEFDLVPGVLPGWDNTARYGEKAHVVHGATPRLFEEWLLASLRKTMSNKPDHRFVIVNAWNEWAEGAHLEPDQRFGYAFLNSVARAKSRLSNQP